MELKLLLDILNQAQLLKSQLDELRPLSNDVEARILQKLRLDWNYHSNHLEGGKLTYGETKALILFGITANGKPLQDHLEVSGHNEAIEWIVDVIKKEYPLNENFIRQLHEIILKKPYFKKAITPTGEIVEREIQLGQYKTTPNHVKTKTGEIFYFASPEETPAKMNDLLDWYKEKKEKSDTNTILFAAEFHYKFIRIHPFDDGNGRLARLIMNFILMQFGYPPAIIKTEDKENYYAVLRQADAGILESFMGYIAQNVMHSLELMLKGARGESIEDPDDLDKQIALLEQQLKTFGDKVEKIKSRETLLDWATKNLTKLITKFIRVNEKFTNIYVSKEFGFFGYYWAIDHDPYEGGEYISSKVVSFGMHTTLEQMFTAFEETMLILLDEEIEDKNYVRLGCTYKMFNRTNVTTFDYRVLIEIRFDKTKYHIHGLSSDKKLSKLYHQELTNEEIDYVLNAEAQAHLDFIQQKLKENELPF